MATMESGPLSPSIASFLNMGAIEDSTTTSNNEDSSTLDLFRYYLALQEQQQQQSQSQSGPSALSMSEIEQPSMSSTSSYNSSALFPFADASPSTSSAASSLPPSAFGFTTAGSELPLQMDTDAQNSLWASFANSLAQPKIEEQEPMLPAVQLQVQSAPAPTIEPQPSRKRARSSIPVEPIEEEENDDEDEQEEEDDFDEDDGNDASFGSTSAATRTTRSSRSKRAAPAPSKRAVSVSSSSASIPSSTRPAKKAAVAQSHPHALVPVPEWEDKLSKEEYDKLSSKEKRQMRNKISARNFRHRRKAHIDTLEAEIVTKDNLIGVLQNEVGTLRAENVDLRADIEMLKKNWESIAAKISAASAPTVLAAMPPAAAPVRSIASSSATSQPALSPDEDDLYGAPSLPALSPPSSSASTNGEGDEPELALPGPSSASTSTTRRSTRSSTTKQAKPNLRKDLSAAGAGFWDSSSPFSSAFRGFGAQGGMDVHTTLVPDFRISPGPMAALSEKRENGLDHFGTANAFARQAPPAQAPQQNMNPALNALSAEQIANLRDQFSASSSALPGRDRARQMAGKEEDATSSFFEQNPFLLLRGESFQDYRGQLYAKLANNAAGIAASNSALRAGAAAPPEGLKPAFFAGSPPSEQQVKEAQLGAVAVIAQKTLLSKLSTAFWDAFSGQTPQAKSLLGDAPARKEVDGKKVADVLAGRSRLEVVENKRENTSSATGLEDQLEKLALRK